MPVGTPLHDRTHPLCRSLNYRDWAGYYAAGSYEPRHEHEYHAIRHGAALLDVSPLFKYLVRGRDAARLIDRVITRDAGQLEPGRVIYTPWCDERGRVIDDGTVSRLAEDRFRWTSTEPNLRWIGRHAAGLDVDVTDVSADLAAMSIQGPTSAGVLRRAAEADIDALRYFHVTPATVAGRAVEISRTGYTGDLGYEIWTDRGDAGAVWDALVDAGRAFNLRPAGLLALDLARIEAGLLLIDVDFVGARRALTAAQYYTALEAGHERRVDFRKEHFIGRDALLAERERGPARRVVGLVVDWPAVEALHEALALAPVAPAAASRVAVPVYAADRQVGRMTSSMWSPVLKQMIGLATVEAAHAGRGARVDVEVTVDAARHRVGATVTPTPFFNPRRKTQTPPP